VREREYVHVDQSGPAELPAAYGVATTSRLHKIIRLSGKRAL